MLRELEAAIEDIHNSDVGWIDVLVCMCVWGGGGSVLRELEAAIEGIHNSDVGWIDVLVCMYVCGGGTVCSEN